MTVSIFGIRHHGPGSARSLRNSLVELSPDCVLVEGPPDADEILDWAKDEHLVPPVAMMVYQPTKPSSCSFYPYANFSPEWQSIRFAMRSKIPVRFIDLPMHHHLAMRESSVDLHSESQDHPNSAESYRTDPLGSLAQLAGFADGESWWLHMVENRLDGQDLFEVIQEAMLALREKEPANGSGLEAMREAYMRQCIRQAEKEGYDRIAVVCGAWHAPALADRDGTKEDKALLKGLPKVKVESTWIPWTYQRLAVSSGYGAGVRSPGWFHHLWNQESVTLPSEENHIQKTTISWMTRVARLMRAEGLDVSSAHVIEAVRLAECLAAMRGRPFPSLDEIDDAILSVMCLGDSVRLALIHEKLHIGERIGRVPSAIPTVPLQQDIEALQRRLRLKPQPGDHTLDLDLRKPFGIARSHLLHRLALLDIPWGEPLAIGKKKGTFHEVWRLEWQPEFAIQIIEAAVWGNSLEIATGAFIVDKGAQADLSKLSDLVKKVLLADLPSVLGQLIQRLKEEAAKTSDVAELMLALPPLAETLRYGDVRKTDTSQISLVIEGLVTRLSIGLPFSCTSLDDEASEQLAAQIRHVDTSIRLVALPEQTGVWQDALRKIVDKELVNGIISGTCCRLLCDAGAMDYEHAGTQMNLIFSPGGDTFDAASWLDGFLVDGSQVLLHDRLFWDEIDSWLQSLDEEPFVDVLPLIRRTFSRFSHSERRQMGVRAKAGAISMNENGAPGNATNINIIRADRTLGTVRRYLNLDE